MSIQRDLELQTDNHTQTMTSRLIINCINFRPNLSQSQQIFPQATHLLPTLFPQELLNPVGVCSQDLQQARVLLMILSLDIDLIVSIHLFLYIKQQSVCLFVSVSVAEDLTTHRTVMVLHYSKASILSLFLFKIEI